MRRASLPFALAVFVCSTVCAEARSWSDIQTTGTLRVIVAKDEQPEMFNTGPAGDSGFERELVEGFARLHRLRLEPVVVGRYKDRLPALLEDRGDAIMGIIKTPARERHLDFSPETFPTRNVVVTARPHRVIKTLQEFRHERVGLLQGTTTWLAATTGAGVDEAAIRLYPNLEAVLTGLESGQISATVMSVSDLGLARHKHPDLQAGLAVGNTRSATWAVRKGNSELLKVLSRYVSSVRRAPTWSRLFVKYFGAETLLALGKQ